MWCLAAVREGPGTGAPASPPPPNPTAKAKPAPTTALEIDTDGLLLSEWPVPVVTLVSCPPILSHSPVRVTRTAGAVTSDQCCGPRGVVLFEPEAAPDPARETHPRCRWVPRRCPVCADARSGTSDGSAGLAPRSSSITRAAPSSESFECGTASSQSSFSPTARRLEGVGGVVVVR